MQNIFVFGGSFDPVHKGHLALIDAIFSMQLADLFLVVPTGNHAEGKKHIFSSTQRTLMLKLSCGLPLNSEEKKYLELFNIPIDQFATQGFPRPLVIREDEIVSVEKSYTISLMERLESEFPTAKLHLLIGEDQAQNFSRWHRAEDLAQKTSLWVYRRKGSAGHKDFQWNVIEADCFDISSSQIRMWLENQSDEFYQSSLIPDPVKTLAPLFYQKNLSGGV